MNKWIRRAVGVGALSVGVLFAAATGAQAQCAPQHSQPASHTASQPASYGGQHGLRSDSRSGSHSAHRSGGGSGRSSGGNTSSTTNVSQVGQGGAGVITGDHSFSLITIGIGGGGYLLN